MKPYNVEVLNIRYQRPGINKLDFTAQYDGYTRRGTVIYDTIAKQFMSHNSDIDLLAGLCINLQQPRCHKK